MGITGTKKPSLLRVRKSVKEIKRTTNLPVLVGFGIKNKSQITQISKFADGAVIGSSLIQIIEDSIQKKNKSEIIVKKVSSFIKSLK